VCCERLLEENITIINGFIAMCDVYVCGLERRKIGLLGIEGNWNIGTNCLYRTVEVGFLEFIVYPLRWRRRNKV